MLIVYLLVFLAGVASVVSPCILPVLPIIFAGSMGEWKRGFAIVLGMTTVFGLLGTVLGSFSTPLFKHFAGILLILFGAIMVSDKLYAYYSTYSSRLVGRVKVPASSFLFGATLGVVWTPCIGPLLGAALSVAAMEGSFNAPILMLFYGMGMGLTIAVVLKLGEKARERIAEKGGIVRKVAGWIIIAFAILTL